MVELEKLSRRLCISHRHLSTKGATPAAIFHSSVIPFPQSFRPLVFCENMSQFIVKVCIFAFVAVSLTSAFPMKKRSDRFEDMIERINQDSADKMIREFNEYFEKRSDNHHASSVGASVAKIARRGDEIRGDWKLCEAGQYFDHREAVVSYLLTFSYKRL